MPYPTDLALQQLVTLPRASLSALRLALLRDTGAAFATFLQEAGYAGGDTVYAAYRDWLTIRGAESPEALSLEAFAVQAGAFFTDTGWGRVSVVRIHDVAALVESPEWAESDPDARYDHPACHVTSGLFASFFGRVGDQPLAVLEVTCRSSGADACRFVIGSAAVVQHTYDEVARGADYRATLDALV